MERLPKPLSFNAALLFEATLQLKRERARFEAVQELRARSYLSNSLLKHGTDLATVNWLATH